MLPPDDVPTSCTPVVRNGAFSRAMKSALRTISIAIGVEVGFHVANRDHPECEPSKRSQDELASRSAVVQKDAPCSDG